MSEFSIVCEAYDNADGKKKRDWENIALGAAGVTGGALGLAGNRIAKNYVDNQLTDRLINYKSSADYYRKIGDNMRAYDFDDYASEVQDQKKYNNIASNIGLGVAALQTASGVGSLMFRSKRQQIVFQKVMERFPTAKDMCAFLEQQNMHPRSLNPNTPDQQYAVWVQREIVKKGRFWNVILHFLFGFGFVGLGVNAYKYAKSKAIPAEELVYDQMKDKQKYDHMIAK